MTTAERIQRINERDEQNKINMNQEIDKCKMAYKIKDTEGNVFVFGGIESGFPWYRGIRGSKHIFDLNGMTIIQQHAE